MSDNMQPIDETLDDESLDAVDAEANDAYEDVEEFDPFEGMSDEELDALCDEGIVKERRTDVDDAKIALVFLFCHTTQPLSSSAARNALAILLLS